MEGHTAYFELHGCDQLSPPLPYTCSVLCSEAEEARAALSGVWTSGEPCVGGGEVRGERLEAAQEENGLQVEGRRLGCRGQVGADLQPK